MFVCISISNIYLLLPPSASVSLCISRTRAVFIYSDTVEDGSPGVGSPKQLGGVGSLELLRQSISPI